MLARSTKTNNFKRCVVWLCAPLAAYQPSTQPPQTTSKPAGENDRVTFLLNGCVYKLCMDRHEVCLWQRCAASVTLWTSLFFILLWKWVYFPCAQTYMICERKLTNPNPIYSIILLLYINCVTNQSKYNKSVHSWKENVSIDIIFVPWRDRGWRYLFCEKCILCMKNLPSQKVVCTCCFFAWNKAFSNVRMCPFLDIICICGAARMSNGAFYSKRSGLL